MEGGREGERREERRRKRGGGGERERERERGLDGPVAVNARESRQTLHSAKTELRHPSE